MAYAWGYLLVKEVPWEQPEILSAHPTLREATSAAMALKFQFGDGPFDVIELPSLKSVVRYEWFEDWPSVYAKRIAPDKRWKMREAPTAD